MSIRLVFVRHGKTNSAEEAGNDFDRTLTLLGREQAVRIREKIGTSFDVVFTSPAPRAQQTARIIAGRNVQLHEIPAFYWHPNQRKHAELDAIWARLGYISLADYLKEPGMDELLRETSEAAIDRLQRLERLFKLDKAGSDKPTLLVGHFLLINDLILRVAENKNNWNSPAIAEFVKTTNLGPGEAFEIICPNNGEPSIRHITLN